MIDQPLRPHDDADAPVGRGRILGAVAEGHILFGTAGDLAARLDAPSFHIDSLEPPDRRSARLLTELVARVLGGMSYSLQMPGPAAWSARPPSCGKADGPPGEAARASPHGSHLGRDNPRRGPTYRL